MRERHPAGTRITLQSMNDPYSRLQPGDTGTLVLIDDIGTYHVHWDNGSSLGLIPGELTPEELEQLKDYLSGQASDGWGEGFEQHTISLEEGDLYVHLWSPDNWEILTEDERFTQKIAPGLPERCFSTLGFTGELILINRGESGYYHSVWSTESREENEELAELYNGRLGVTPAQRRAMEVGSMFGWDVPGADPAQYEISAMAMEEM